ncbi:hypothetical protein LX15_003919 [Streptoalloteichus tenebrarius]|uniref:Uncharacterized protein n=1 Tax=Streptoalloteichus tenebrarius (strain ATCC 17920 / DSM 40477 / JCM 4838 / CBS 697.72 / NBRC 16177 / NCIMB 11028 / NRRL B-12390 / A12253. 1 / ISP 5477) TaxID=1933 RepID=A0ABT1HXG5_STRSD|nr:hypothetical protein [Streptoalloteichus tenebrarius]MCP2260206.1 hypothetical protein [Streptoalloteichus tenebrarius]
MSEVDEAMRRFLAAVDSASDRGRRAVAEARERDAAFRGATGDLVDRVRRGGVPARRDELTAERLRAAATGFRVEHRLPVEELPSGAELLAEHSLEQKKAFVSGNVGEGAANRRRPAETDDDEDFSQERILY